LPQSERKKSVKGEDGTGFSSPSGGGEEGVRTPKTIYSKKKHNQGRRGTRVPGLEKEVVRGIEGTKRPANEQEEKGLGPLGNKRRKKSLGRGKGEKLTGKQKRKARGAVSRLRNLGNNQNNYISRAPSCEQRFEKTQESGAKPEGLGGNANRKSCRQGPGGGIFEGTRTTKTPKEMFFFLEKDLLPLFGAHGRGGVTKRTQKGK